MMSHHAHNIREDQPAREPGRAGGPALSRVAAALVLFAAWLLPADSARGQESREYQLKAAFIYNFVQFVEWPAKAFGGERDPLVIGIVGADPFHGALDAAIKDKSVGKRQIVIRRYGSVADIGVCHALFVVPGHSVGAVREKIGSAAVLTIGESDDFARGGGIIRLFKEDNKVRFEINNKAAEAAQLRISSKLLKLARPYQE